MTDNSKHLIAHKKNESEKKIEAVRDTVSYMLYASEEINLNKVAKKVVSKKTKQIAPTEEMTEVSSKINSSAIVRIASVACCTISFSLSAAELQP